MNPYKITFIQTTSQERLEQTKRCVKRVRPYVDAIVLISPVQITGLEVGLTHILVREWHDDLPAYLNEALNEVKEGWILRFDPDEYPNVAFLEAMGQIVSDSGNGMRYNWVKLNCHDKLDANEPTRMPYYRAALWKWYPSLKYMGVGIGVDHEQLIGAPFRPLRLPDDQFYVHEKTTLEMRTGSWRRFHVAGGGNALGPENPVWIEYCQLLQELYPALVKESRTQQKIPWQALLPVIKQGNVDQHLKDWMNKYRNRNVIPDADQELRESWELYFVLLHPEENVASLTQKPETPPPDTENYRFIEEAYIKILGRHADTEGKKNYAQRIKEGKLRKEDLERELMASVEYAQLVNA